MIEVGKGRRRRDIIISIPPKISGTVEPTVMLNYLSMYMTNIQIVTAALNSQAESTLDAECNLFLSFSDIHKVFSTWLYNSI